MPNKKNGYKKLVEGEGLRKKGPIMGLDVHKEMIQYCIVSEKQILEENEINNSKNGLKRLVSVIKKRKVSNVIYFTISYEGNVSLIRGGY